MKHFTGKYDDALVQILDRIVPLTQLMKLTIKNFDIAFTKFIHILYATPNLHTFKTDFLSVDTINTVPITTNDFQCVLMTNKIKTFDLCHSCTLKKN